MNSTEIKAAANAFKEAANGEIVPDDLIKKRAATCRNCPMKKRTRGLSSRISMVLGSLANKHKVPKEIHQNMCGVCGCSLMLLIPAKKSSLHQDSPKEKAKRPFSCWFNWEA